MKNHRVVVTAHGGPDVLKVIEEDLPEPGEGEVRLRVLAAGVSAYDAMLRSSGRCPAHRACRTRPVRTSSGWWTS